MNSIVLFSHLHSILMQDLNSSRPRKLWYERMIDIAFVWKPAAKDNKVDQNTNKEKIKRSTSLNLTSTFTRVCLCAPVSSYNEIFQAEVMVPPRRSNTYPRSKQFSMSSERRAVQVTNARRSVEGRRVFRGKSLSDDLIMRKFVVEEAMMMQMKRRNQMEFVKGRNLKRKKLGPSPLSRMVMANDV